MAQPDFGVLFDDMAHGDGELLPFRALQQPKVEEEVAFVLGRDLSMPHPTHLDVIAATDHVLPALEIVSSRIAGWDIRFVDTVADNASAGAFVLGCTQKWLRAGLRYRSAAVRHGADASGEPVSTGAGAACLGHPLNAVAWLARTMAAVGEPLRAGEVVLSSALGPMIPAAPGDVFEGRIYGLGSVRAVFDSHGAAEVSA